MDEKSLAFIGNASADDRRPYADQVAVPPKRPAVSVRRSGRNTRKPEVGDRLAAGERVSIASPVRCFDGREVALSETTTTA
jgi:hypothetical protein